MSSANESLMQVLIFLANTNIISSAVSVKTWSGETYQLKGDHCDLVLLRAPGFDLQVRTANSLIERAAVKVGEDVLEVSTRGVNYFNGMAESHYKYPIDMGDHAVATNDNPYEYEVVLDPDTKIIIQSLPDRVLVRVEAQEAMKDSTGLLASSKGEWRVQESLFQKALQTAQNCAIHEVVPKTPERSLRVRHMDVSGDVNLEVFKLVKVKFDYAFRMLLPCWGCLFGTSSSEESQSTTKQDQGTKTLEFEAFISTD